MCYCSFIMFFLSACGQSPEIKLHVYSQVTLPGIRPESENDDHNFPKSYFFYAEAKKDVKFTLEGCWIEGKYHSAGIEMVSSPVIIANQSVITEQQDTLVKKSDKAVYHIIPGGQTERLTMDEAEKKSVTENQFVLIVKVNNKLQFITVKKIKELSPAAMM